MRVLLMLLGHLLPAPWIALAAAAAVEAPAPPLDPLLDRILFLALFWAVIAALLLVLRWKIAHADALSRMMPPPAATPSEKPSHPKAPLP